MKSLGHLLKHLCWGPFCRLYGFAQLGVMPSLEMLEAVGIEAQRQLSGFGPQVPPLIMSPSQYLIETTHVGMIALCQTACSQVPFLGVLWFFCKMSSNEDVVMWLRG